MRDGNVTGSVNAPLPAFASPLPSITEPCQSTSTCRSNVAIAPSLLLYVAGPHPRHLCLAAYQTASALFPPTIRFSQPLKRRGSLPACASAYQAASALFPATI